MIDMFVFNVRKNKKFQINVLMCLGANILSARGRLPVRYRVKPKPFKEFAVRGEEVLNYHVCSVLLVYKLISVSNLSTVHVN